MLFQNKKKKKFRELFFKKKSFKTAIQVRACDEAYWPINTEIRTVDSQSNFVMVLINESIDQISR